MLKVAQKCKNEVACLLLFSFLNVMTFLPGSQHISTLDTVYSYTNTFSNEDDGINRSTILELLLENVAGLKDCLPNSEKPDFSYHYFSAKFRTMSSALLNFTPLNFVPEVKPALIAQRVFPTAGEEHLPHLQHHNFIFRLTPF